MLTFIRRTIYATAVFAALLPYCVTASAAPCGTSAPNILGGQYDSYRTSSNLSETTLNPGTVSKGFGYLFEYTPDAGLIYAQPLIEHNLTIAGTCYQTVVFAATMKNQIIAFNGDNPSGGSLWRSQPFGTATTSSSVVYPPVYCKEGVGFPNVGILSTPVIDNANSLMYFVTLNDTQQVSACSSTGSTGWVYTLHAISLKPDSSFGRDYIPPHDINADLQPYGFVGQQQLQRPALLDVDGGIFVGFGFGTSSNDGGELQSEYQGWMAQYNSCATGSQTCPTSTCFTQTNCSFFYASAAHPNPFSSHGAGVWMSGMGPASDGTYYSFSTGNGCYPNTGSTPKNCSPMKQNELGDSVIMRPTSITNANQGSTFTPEDTFESPGFMNYYVDDYNDLDVSSGGVIMIPPAAPQATSSFLIASGKAGQTYVLPTSDLGGYTSTPYQGFFGAASTAPCTVPFPVSPQTPLYGGIVPNGGGCAEIHNPAYWNLGNGTGFYFVWGFGDILRGYYFDGSILETTATSTVPPLVGTSSSLGGGALSVSANGSDTSTAVLWAVTSTGFAYSPTNFQSGALVAHQIYTTAGGYGIQQIYNSQTQTGKTFHAQRYVAPLVDNGRVYVSTVQNGSGSIFVYGPCSFGMNGQCGTQP